MLLYTYISRFSVNPHGQQWAKNRQSCCHKFYPQPPLIVFFNFAHKRPTFAFTDESEYTLGFRRRIAHSGLHAETGGPSGRGRYHYPRSVPHVHKHPRAGCQNGKLCRFLALVEGRSRRTQRAFGTAMRLCASLSRGAAAPLGCVIFSVSVEIATCMPCAQGLSVCARRGVVSLLSARFTCC